MWLLSVTDHLSVISCLSVISLMSFRAKVVSVERTRRPNSTIDSCVFCYFAPRENSIKALIISVFGIALFTEKDQKYINLADVTLLSDKGNVSSICVLSDISALRASMSGDRYLGDGATNRHESLHDGIDLSFGQSFSHFGGDIFKGVFIATQLNSTVTYQ